MKITTKYLITVEDSLEESLSKLSELVNKQFIYNSPFKLISISHSIVQDAKTGKFHASALLLVERIQVAENSPL